LLEEIINELLPGLAWDCAEVEIEKEMSSMRSAAKGK
jgi:hypothetical protein